MKRLLGSASALAGLAAVMFALAPAAFGASTPTVTTGTAAAVTGATAQITATVNPNGQSTTYAFQYGTTTNYGSQTATTSAGSGTSAVDVRASLSHLVSNTTYHYRVVATNGSGTSSGADGTFTTAAVPPTVTLGHPSVVNSDSATLNGIVNPNGKATTYSFQYGPTTSYGLQTAAATVGSGSKDMNVHATVSGLSSGTTYHYRVVATSPDGTTASSDGSFQTTGTPSPGGTLPVVSQATSVKLAQHSVQLNGAINPEGPKTTWYFQYGLTTYYGMETTPQVTSGLGARAINAQLYGLQSNATYHYRLVAYSSGGLYVGPDHTFTTQSTMRARLYGIVLHPYIRRERGGVAIAVFGSLRVPSGLSRSAVCNGAIGIQIRRGHDTIGYRRTWVRHNCSYQLRTFVSYGRLGNVRELGILGRFQGNQLLMPAKAAHGLRVP